MKPAGPKAVPEADVLTLPPRLAKWLPQFEAAERCYGVPVAILAAVCDRETRGGEACTPKGPAGTGDGGHGRGLMQIDDRFHHRFVVARFDDGAEIWTDPAFNILYGARLLARVYGVTGRWAVALCAYNSGASRAIRILKSLQEPTDEELWAALDKVTTGGNYVSDCLGKAARFGAGAV